MTAPRSEKERQTRRFGLAYQGAFEAVFAILVGAGLGYWADASFDTAPGFLLAGLLLGFGAFVLRLIRLGRQLQDLAGRESPEPASREADEE